MVRKFIVFCFYSIAFSYIFVGNIGCSSLGEVFTQVKYKQDFTKANDLDLKVQINDVEYLGVGVVPRAQEYKVTVYPNNNTKRIRIRTCHRKLVIDEPSKGWLSSGYKIDFDPTTSRLDHYTTAKEVEDIQSCIMRISALDKADEEHAEAIFDFLDARPEVSLKGVKIQCNGIEDQPQFGSGICKAPVDTYQRVQMPTFTIYRTTEDCKGTLSSLDDKNYILTPNPGICQYYFTSNTRAENGKWNKFRLTVYGIVKYPFKGDK